VGYEIIDKWQRVEGSLTPQLVEVLHSLHFFWIHSIAYMIHD
jgi:hypothetical protein